MNLNFLAFLIFFLSLQNIWGQEKTVAFDILVSNINVIDVENGEILEGLSIGIKGNRIAKIFMSSENTTWLAEKTIDGSGKYILPGLWDMHVHLFDNGKPNFWKLQMMLTHGVTGVREMFIKPNQMMDYIQPWRDSINNNLLVAPRIGAAGTLVDGPPAIQSSLTVSNLEEARAFVKEIKSAGVDFVKVYDNLSKTAYDALNKAAQEEGLYIAGHVPSSISLVYASETGMRTIEHLTGLHLSCSHKEDSLRAHYMEEKRGFMRSDMDLNQFLLESYDNQKSDYLISALAKNKTWMVPTLVLKKNWLAGESLSEMEMEPEISYIPNHEYRDWQELRDYKTWVPIDYQKSTMALYTQEKLLLKKMHEKGVPILAGTDVGVPYVYPGLSLLKELQEMTEAGLTNIDAIRTATINPAIFLETSDSLGTVEEGKLADLLILNSNPLIDITNLKKQYATIFNGKYLSREELDEMRQNHLVSNYRTAQLDVAPLKVKKIEKEKLAGLQGTYVNDQSGSQVIIEWSEEMLTARFTRFTDKLEPLSPSLFRAENTNIHYLFKSNKEGRIWGFELIDNRGSNHFKKID